MVEDAFDEAVSRAIHWRQIAGRAIPLLEQALAEAQRGNLSGARRLLQQAKQEILVARDKALDDGDTAAAKRLLSALGRIRQAQVLPRPETVAEALSRTRQAVTGSRW